MKLNKLKLDKNKAALAFMICALLITLCCGKRKAPLPPLDKVLKKTEFSGIQQGNKVILTWSLPKQSTPHQNSSQINRTDVYRLVEVLSTPATLTEEEFSSRSTLIATLPIPAPEFEKEKITYTDTLEFVGQPARLRYAIRFVNSSGQKAAFSNFLLIEPTAKVADVPKNLQAITTKDFVLLKWEAPLSNVDDSKPANILGYNVYRANKVGDIKRLNNILITGEEFSDQFFEFENEYRYFVRSVSLGSAGEQIESLNSNSFAITVKDVFPPSVPSALTIAAAPKNLSIFFSFNDEKDVAGYKIYRTTNPNSPKSEWSLLINELLTTNTFQDETVESGKTYFYYLIAVDKFGNLSEPSEVVSETAL